MNREFQVGEWHVEPDLNSIRTAGGKTSVEPRVIEVLAYLADHPGEVLSKKQILQAVWPDTFVSDEVLRYSIAELRKAFKDNARNPRIIDTIPRRGYRLIAPVTKKRPAVEPQISVAVLAFSDLSASKDQQYFCEGMSEEIVNNLTSMKSLRVASRTSSFAFKDKAQDVRTIGRKLGVSAVLEGSVRKEGNQLRIVVQLISAADGCNLWSQRYDRELKDVFAIQEEIAHSIAVTLNVALMSMRHIVPEKVPA